MTRLTACCSGQGHNAMLKEESLYDLLKRILGNAVLQFDAADDRTTVSVKNTSGVATDDPKLVRYWYEVNDWDIGGSYTWMDTERDVDEAKFKWCPYNRHAADHKNRRWFGSYDYVAFWENRGQKLCTYALEIPPTAIVRDPNSFFHPVIDWSYDGGMICDARYAQDCDLGDASGSAVYASDPDAYFLLALLNSSEGARILRDCFSQDPKKSSETAAKLSLLEVSNQKKFEIIENARELIKIAKKDWNSQEISPKFTGNPLINQHAYGDPLEATVLKLQSQYRKRCSRYRNLELLNRDYFLELVKSDGVSDPADIKLSELALNCNPYHRHTDEEAVRAESLALAAGLANAEKGADIRAGYMRLQRADLMRDLVSYAVGCMFGRYAPDDGSYHPVLVCSSSNDLYDEIENFCGNSEKLKPCFENIVPMVKGFFEDDIVALFRLFLSDAFGEKMVDVNLRYVEECLNLKRRPNYTMWDYFSEEFYADHLKRYRNCPIYWMFESPKKSFRALVFMHRIENYDNCGYYRSGEKRSQLGRLRKSYVKPMQKELLKRLADAKSRLRAKDADLAGIKGEIACLESMFEDIKGYSNNTLDPLILEEPHIDDDLGVRANYLKFAKALRRLPNLKPGIN